MLTGERGYERRLDMMLRLGPYGDAFGAHARRADAATGSRPPRTASTSARCSPGCPGSCAPGRARSSWPPRRWSPMAARLRDRVGRGGDAAELVLIGRRHLRSNNSWMHNVPALAGGTNRCTLHIHPDDAARFGIDGARGGQRRRWRGRRARRAHRRHPARRGVAAARLGARSGRAPGWQSRRRSPASNVNQLNDGSLLDPLSGHRRAQRSAGHGVSGLSPPGPASAQLPYRGHVEAHRLLSRLDRCGRHRGVGHRTARHRHRRAERCRAPPRST